MSIPDESQSLANVIARYRFAYLMTTNDAGTPHAVQVAVALQGTDLVINDVGHRSRGNALARPAVGLVFPPQSAADYSLIVDGLATGIGESLRVAPTRAVLHRPSPPSTPGASGTCGADCVELSLESLATRARQVAPFSTVGR